MNSSVFRCHDIESLDLSASELTQLKTEGAAEYKHERETEYAVRRVDPTRKRHCRAVGW